MVRLNPSGELCLEGACCSLRMTATPSTPLWSFSPGTGLHRDTSGELASAE